MCVCVRECVCERNRESVREKEGEKLLAENSVGFIRKTILCRIKGSRTSVGNPIQKEKHGLLLAFAAPDFLPNPLPLPSPLFTTI